jgi:hypothetical protein
MVKFFYSISLENLDVGPGQHLVEVFIADRRAGSPQQFSSVPRMENFTASLQDLSKGSRHALIRSSKLPAQPTRKATPSPLFRYRIHFQAFGPIRSQPMPTPQDYCCSPGS